MDLDIYRGLSIWITLKVDDNTRLISQLLGECVIKTSFNSHIFLDIGIGDFIVYGGIIYHVNSLPNIKKNSVNSYDYDITFESESYELLKTQFLDSDENSDFYLIGNLETFIDLIITNMGREHTGWVKGTCDQTNTDYKLLSFKEKNCLKVLNELCEEFGGEFYFEFSFDFVEGAKLPYISADSAVVGYKPAVSAEHVYRPAETSITNYTKDICFTDKAGSDSGLTFKYKQGLRNIHRTTLSEKNIITRLYAFGSDKNLASDYRDYSRRLKFVSDGKSYLEKNTDKYGTIEHTEMFDGSYGSKKDIYPHRDGTISEISGDDITKFRDSGMDFDLNDYLLPGVTAKIHFNTGNLAGYEFEVHAYNNSTKEFTIIAYKDERGYELPNATLKPDTGDKYILLDIEMPQGYIDTAETTLQTEAQAYLDDNCEPRVTYFLGPDWRYFKTHFIELKAGDFITIEDTVLGIDVMTRIVELTKSVANKYKYTLKLTDHLEVQLIKRLYSGQENLKEKIEIGYGGDIVRSRRNWRTSEELRSMIYDTDGKFDMDNIRPLSVQTGMLSVGTKSTQFILKEIEIEGNYQSDASEFHASAGQLIHLSIADEIRTWTLSENTQNSLVNETAYYIYAKCTKEPGYTGQIVADETQRKFDDDETYYYFLIGVLHSVVDGVRGVSLTYGQTIINGKFIRTGKIESTNGTAYLDLDNDVIMLPDASVTAGKIAVNSITADRYNELRNTYVFNGEDSLDPTHPFELRFLIVPEMTAIQNIKLSLGISKFRAYAKGIPSGGGHTTPSGGGHTTPSGGGSTSGASSASGHSGHKINAYEIGHNVGDENIDGSIITSIQTGASFATATHTHIVYDHQHIVSNHQHTVSNHVHSLTYGIYEKDTSPKINVYVSNDGINYGDSIGEYEEDYLNIDITGISGPGWKRIKFTSDVLARVSAIIVCKIDLSA